MQISREEIIHIAKLASLNLTEEEIDNYTENMQDILNFANIINNVDTENVEDSIGVSGNYNVFRKDEIKVFGDRDVLLQNAPTQDEGMFQIPKVIS